MTASAPTRRTRAPRRELLSVAEAAAEAGVSTKTIRRWIKAGDLPAYQAQAGKGLVKVELRDVQDIYRRIRPEEVSA